MIASAAVLVIASGPASAMFHRAPDISSGDDRASAHPIHGHVDCRGAGLPGSTVDAVGFVDNGRNYLMVTALSQGAGLTGLVVESGLAYNVYPAARLDALPYLELHSPIYRGDSPAPIRYWFACGIMAATTGTDPGQGSVGTPAATAAPPADDDPGSVPETDSTTGPGHDPGSDQGTDPSTDPSSDRGDGGGTVGLPDTAGSADPGRPGESAAAGATPGVLADATPPAGYSAHLRNAANVGLGASVYLALAMLLLVIGGLLVVAPGKLGLALARLRQRD